MAGPSGHVFPLGSRLDEAGRLEIGGCDVIELTREFGTPAYVYAEDDIRTRARAYMDAFRARVDRFEVIYASKAFPCTAVERILVEEGLACDVASGGELHIALAAGFDPVRIYMHGNNKTPAELDYALEAGVGQIVVDSFDEIDRLERLAAGRDQAVLLRVTPGVEPATHAKIATGQKDSKFGIPLALVPRAIERCAEAGLDLQGLHAHIGSQVFDLGVFETLVAVLIGLGRFPVLNLGGGFACAYTRDEHPPAVEQYAEAMLGAVDPSVRVVCEPGRSLVANAGVSLYTVGTVKEIPGLRTYVSVDGGMSDNPRPMLYDAAYEAEIADRFGDSTPCRIAGKHCESGDVLVRDAAVPADLAVGDVLATPVTGAYGHSMGSNYNKVPRPPVVFVADGDARVVVRGETEEDLL
nr:diaminopimelate decarboxylase [Actinomycetota bacterium]